MRVQSKTIACALVFAFSLSLHAQNVQKFLIPSTLYNVDIDAASASTAILVELFPLKQHNNNESAGPCPNARYEATGPSFKFFTDRSGGFALRVPAGQYFAVITSESFGLVSSCITVATPEDAKACGASPPPSGQPLQTMIVRYSRRLRFFHGDILMSHPCAAAEPTACASLHEAYPLLLDGRQIQLQYSGKPLRNAAVKITTRSRIKQPDLFSMNADRQGVLDAGALYSLAGEAGTHVLLRIQTGEGGYAELAVRIPPQPSNNKQTLALFQRRKCGWEAEVIQ